ncbi:MAG: hypothetical protein OHK0039_28390 [Bacteroidia bacterium]
MKRLPLVFLLIGQVYGQILTVIPPQPTADDTVTIIFDARAGNGVLRGHDGPVYAHTGAIIGTADEPSGWRYVQGNWGTDDARMKMEALGNDRYRMRFHIRSFYGIPSHEPFLQMGFVFRNRNGSLVAKDTADRDIYYPRIQVYEHGPLEKASGKDGVVVGMIDLSLAETEGAVTFVNQRGDQVTLRSFGEGILNLTYLPGITKRPSPSESVIRYPEPLVAPDPALGDRPNEWRFGPDMRIHVHYNPFGFDILYRGDTLLRSEKGFFTDTGDPAVGLMTGLRLHLQPGERLYGTGSRAVPLDRRGQRLYAYNTASYGYTLGETDINISIPYVQSSRGYGLFFDSYSRGYFDLGSTEPGVFEFGSKDSSLSCFILTGDDPAEVQQRYMYLTGTQPLPPRWALGYIQSRYGYQSQAETEDIVQQTLDSGFPLDAVLLDLYWFGGKERMGDFDWEPIQWPQPDSLIDRLDRRGVQTILISETYFVEGTRHMDDLRQRGLLATYANGQPYIIPDFWAGAAGLLDVFHPEAKAWFWPLYQAQTDRGIAGWWCDSGEPENHPKAMYHQRGKAEEIHNLYAYYWARLLHESFAEARPGERFFNLMRSGFAGMQRYSTFPWSGDVSRSWEALRAQPMIMLGAGMSGVPYMHSDLGGFTGGPKDEDLYRRWVQMGTFVPVMRIHGDATGIAPEPIFFSAETQRIVLDALRLRSRMLPYNYTLAWEQSQTGAPLARPLLYHYPTDSVAARLSDTYLWGRDLLVAPVLEKGLTTRAVYLPGGDWFSLHSGRRVAGFGWIEQPLVKERIPVFVRSGAIIPMSHRNLPNTRAFRGDSLELHVYPGLSDTPLEGQIFLDDGRTTDTYTRGDYRLIRVRGNSNRKWIDLFISGEGRGYAGLERHNLRYVIHGQTQPPRKIWYRGERLNAKDWYWDAEKQTINLWVDWSGSQTDLRLRLRS